MNYKLAKQLKDAGFPQEGHYWYVQWDKGDNEGITVENETSLEWTDAEFSYHYLRLCVSPTISELIEACGDNFYGIERIKDKDGNKWQAVPFPIEYSKATYGLTPEESVAKLWLALQPNNSSAE